MLSFFEVKIILKSQKGIHIHKNNFDNNFKIMFVCSERGLYTI